jgi:hypothetical protein
MQETVRHGQTSDRGDLSDLDSGALNLLRDTGKVCEGENLLIINTTDGSVDSEMTAAIERAGRSLGARVHVLTADKVASVDEVAPLVKSAFETADVTVFNHRISSMLRLMPLKGGRLVGNFFTTAEGLGSTVARMPSAYWRSLLKHVQDRINRARSWRVTCPDGTDLFGTLTPPDTPPPPASGQTFSTVSFPIGIFKPLPADTANGTLMLRWLGTSGIHFIAPESLALDEAVRAIVENGRITTIEGSPATVATAHAFLRAAGERYGKDGYLLNGWHAGINAQVQPEHPASSGVERWLFIGHQSPRIVHFHMVGTDAPGEYSAACIDPTITFDDEVMWSDGRLVFADRPEVKQAISKHGDPALALARLDRIGA